MPRISARTLAVVRQNVNEMLTDTCTIYRESGGKDTSGAPTHSESIVASAVACRVIQSESRFQNQTQVVAGQEALVEQLRLITPVGTPFTVNDRVVLSGGQIYQVVGVEDGLTDSAFANAAITRVRT